MFRADARASGGAGQGWDLPGPGLVEVVVRGDGLGLGGIERRGLIEVAWEVLPGKVFGFGAAEIELSLGRAPGRDESEEARWAHRGGRGSG